MVEIETNRPDGLVVGDVVAEVRRHFPGKLIDGPIFAMMEYGVNNYSINPYKIKVDHDGDGVNIFFDDGNVIRRFQIIEDESDFLGIEAYPIDYKTDEL